MVVQDVLDKLKEQKNKSATETIVEKSRGSFTAAAIGAGVGLVIAHNRGWSLFFSAVVGSVAAGLIANLIVNRNLKSDD